MKKRSVTISGHATSIALEDAFWAELKCICTSKNLSLNALISQIDQNKKGNNLSSAIRLYILYDLKTRLETTQAL